MPQVMAVPLSLSFEPVAGPSNATVSEAGPSRDPNLSAIEELPDIAISAEPNDVSANVDEQEDLPYGHFPFSPFKKYLTLKIGNSSSKNANKKIKAKTPPAISGKDYHAHLIKVRNEKRKMEEDKEKRKAEREAKRLQKQQAQAEKARNNCKGKKRQIHESEDEEESESDEEIAFIESDSDKEEDRYNNRCDACLGNDGLEDNHKWIGCNRCPRWFHKFCLNENVEQMSSEELEAYNFICTPCTKVINSKKIKTRVVRNLYASDKNM